jgi:hypothetical protein
MSSAGCKFPASVFSLSGTGASGLARTVGLKPLVRYVVSKFETGRKGYNLQSNRQSLLLCLLYPPDFLQALSLGHFFLSTVPVDILILLPPPGRCVD